MIVRIKGRNYIKGGGPVNDGGVTIFARKRRRRKSRYIKGFHHSVGRSGVTQALANRRNRYDDSTTDKN